MRIGLFLSHLSCKNIGTHVLLLATGLALSTNLPLAAASTPAASASARSRLQALQARRTAGMPQTRAAAAPGQTPRTPFERVIEPGLKRLLAGKKIAPSRRQSPLVSGDGTLPNFGGYLAAPKFEAYDVTDGDVSGLGVFASGDFNKDGKPDVATIQPSGAVNVILNQSPAAGTTAFSKPITTIPQGSYVGGTLQAIATDVDGDGYDDLLLLDQSANGFDILISKKDGTFAEPVVVSLTGTNYVSSFAVGDVNGDGKPDIVILSANINFDPDTFIPTSVIEIDTYLNDGSGNFLPPTGGLQQIETYPNDYWQGVFGRAIALTDVNGDGKVDATIEVLHLLTTADPSEEHILWTLAGDGSGAFQSPDPETTIAIQAEGTFNIGYPLVANLNVVDVNRDGILDIVFSYQDYSIYVLLGNGDGTYQYWNNVGATGAYPTDLFVSDLNNDGIQDLVDAEPDYLAIYPGHGDGTYDLPTIRNYSSAMGRFSVLAVADFNGDGLPDPAIMNSFEGSVTIFPSVAGPSPILHAATLVPGGDSDVITRIEGQVVLDANGDGKDDILLLNRGAGRDNSLLLTALGDGKGGFLNKNAVPGFDASAFDFTETVTADFNGDGLADVIAHTENNVFLFTSKGDGTFTSSPLPLPAGFNCSTHYGTIGDINGDGKPDIVIPYEGDNIYYCNDGSTPSGFYTLLGNGDGTFQPATFTPLGVEAFAATLVDLNGDGKLDLIISDVPFDVIGGVFNSFILLGKGDGTFGDPVTIAPNFINASTLTADLNGDGKPDLVILTEGLTDPVDGTYDPGQAGAMVLFGDGAGNVTQGQTFAAGFFSPYGLLTDLNGDGKPDLLLSEYLSYDFIDGYVGGIVGLGNGDGTFSGVGNYEVGDASTVVLEGNFLSDNSPDAILMGPSGTTLLLAQGGTLETLKAAASTIPSGGAASFQVTLAPTLAGRPTPTGTVTLWEGTTQLASAPLSAGAATLSVSGLASGSHTITAAYGGDANFNLNSTAQTAVSVLVPATVALSSSSTTLSLSQGQTGVVTLSVSASASFSGGVTLSASGAPGGTTITLNPTTLTLSGGQTASATLVVATVQPKSSALLDSRTGSGMLAAGAGLALLLLIPVHRNRRRLGSVLWVAVAILSLASIGSLAGCGSDNNFNVAPKGSGTITVTATPSDTSVAPQTATINVTIQ